MSRIAVIGGGLMGAGIAQVFATAGHDVAVQEPLAETRATALARIRDGLATIGKPVDIADRVSVTADIAAAVGGAAFVTEAAPERIEIKRAIFAQLVEYAPPDAILASNASVIPITRIADGLATGARMIGTHWWNPAPLIPLVEVVQGAATSDVTVAATMALLEGAGKKPAHVKKDIPGFVANRLQHALWREAIAMVADGVCDARTIDDCVKHSFGLRLAVLGPLENADMIGLDLTRDIHRTIMPELDRCPGPHPVLDAMIDAGRLGFKSGEGFRRWSADEQAALRRTLVDHLVKAAA